MECVKMAVVAVMGDLQRLKCDIRFFGHGMVAKVGRGRMGGLKEINDDITHFYSKL